ncbi:MAG: D-2-hydroxyacid dehydrogenase family protein [Candidatus Puniceispirillaceae bacterium]
MKIAIIDDWQNDAPKSADWQSLANHHQLDFYQDTLTGVDLVERLAPYDIIGIMRERTPMTRALLYQLPNLKAIVTSGMRNLSIDQQAAREKNIMVMGTQSPGHATAELAMTLIGMLARDIFANATSMTQGGWQVSTGSDLRGTTLGVLGLGRLGSQIASLGKAYGMNVQAWSQNLTKDRCDEVGVQYAPKDVFFQTSDFISVHLKMSDRVRHLIGEAELSMMKPTACLVNTSRSGIIDSDALIKALKTGSVRAAATDVFDTEPLPSDAILRQTPNLVMTPHIGYVTSQTMDVFYGQMKEAIEQFIKGSPVRKFDGF